MIRALVVDDEDLARRDLIARLREAGDVEVIAECDDGSAALALAADLRPDVVFLDIRMPGVDGIEVALAMGDLDTAVVFVTAFDQFAVRAFELGSLDYLLKPVQPDRLAVALERVRERSTAAHSPRLGTFLQSPPEDVFVFRSLDALVVLQYAEIQYVEAQANYVHVHGVVNGQDRRWLHRTTLRDLLDRLEPHGFVQVHRSVVVNRAHLREVRPRGKSFEALLSSGTCVPVSRSMRVGLSR